MTKFGIVLMTGILLCSCASSDKSMSHVPWYEHLNPTSEVIVSDWVLFDLDSSSYSGERTFADEMSSEVEFFW